MFPSAQTGVPKQTSDRLAQTAFGTPCSGRSYPLLQKGHRQNVRTATKASFAGLLQEEGWVRCWWWLQSWTCPHHQSHSAWTHGQSLVLVTASIHSPACSNVTNQVRSLSGSPVGSRGGRAATWVQQPRDKDRAVYRHTHGPALCVRKLSVGNSYCLEAQRICSILSWGNRCWKPASKGFMLEVRECSRPVQP